MFAAERRKPNTAEPRIERVKTRSLRSPTAPGDLDANADANRRLTCCRPDTPDHPQSIGSCDVATTILPTKRERYWECAELWRTLDTQPPGCPEVLASRPASERRARQAGPDAFRRSPETNDLPMLPNRLSVDSGAATGHGDVATAMGFPLGKDDRDAQGHGLPRRGSGRMPFPVTLRAASPPTLLPAPENAATTLALGHGANPRRARGHTSEQLPRPSACAAVSKRSLRHAPSRLCRRNGSGRERPSPRSGSHRMSRNALPLASRLRGWRRADTSADTNEEERWFGLRRARAAP